MPRLFFPAPPCYRTPDCDLKKPHLNLASSLTALVMGLALVAACTPTPPDPSANSEPPAPSPTAERCSAVALESPYREWITACQTGTGYELKNIHPVHVLAIEAADIETLTFVSASEDAEVDVKEYAWSLNADTRLTPAPDHAGREVAYLPPGGSMKVITTLIMPEVYVQTVPHITSSFIASLAVARYVDEAANIAFRGRQLRAAASSCAAAADSYVNTDKVENQNPTTFSSQIAQLTELSPCAAMVNTVRKELQYANSLPSFEQSAKAVTKSVTIKFFKDVWEYAKPVAAALK